MDSWVDPNEPMLIIGDGFEMRLGLEDERTLLTVLTKRAADRLKAEQNRVALTNGDLLAARVAAIQAGVVPMQPLKPKPNTLEMLAAMRARSRT